MKDHDTYLAALGALPQVMGILAGVDTNRLRLPRNVRALGLREDVARLCAGADIIVSSSAYGEGFSNALAEGMSAGLVPAATRVGDSAIIADDTGHIVEPRDPAALSAAISKIATMPVALRRREGLKARARIEKNFSLDRAIDRFFDIYEPTGT
jgi:glycosyltransferase involved in cell wall biosynthesis